MFRFPDYLQLSFSHPSFPSSFSSGFPSFRALPPSALSFLLHSSQTFLPLFPSAVWFKGSTRPLWSYSVLASSHHSTEDTRLQLSLPHLLLKNVSRLRQRTQLTYFVSSASNVSYRNGSLNVCNLNEYATICLLPHRFPVFLRVASWICSPPGLKGSIQGVWRILLAQPNLSEPGTWTLLHTALTWNG